MKSVADCKLSAVLIIKLIHVYAPVSHRHAASGTWYLNNLQSCPGQTTYHVHGSTNQGQTGPGASRTVGGFGGHWPL